MNDVANMHIFEHKTCLFKLKFEIYSRYDDKSSLCPYVLFLMLYFK